MKKDFFGGREKADTIYSLCGEPRCGDQESCLACRRQEEEVVAAAAIANRAADVAAVGQGCSGSCDIEPVIAVTEEAAAAAGGGTAAAAAHVAADPPPQQLDNWGYQAWNGPATWHRRYPIAKGRRQSPIDLREADLALNQRGQPLPPLAVCFQPTTGLRLENTGASWLLTWPQDDPGAVCQLRGGPLGSEYRLLQLHAHWGAELGRGSEHTLEGRSFEGELHLVFYNAASYGSPAEAMEQPDGLAVIGIFLSEAAGVEAHPEFDKITRLLEAVLTRGCAVTIEEEVNPGGLLPEPVGGDGGQLAYFTYPGSLTTPPLLESVTWLVMRKPLALPARQMDMMRAMRSGPEEDSDRLVDNFRPPCCAAGRKLRTGTL